MSYETGHILGGIPIRPENADDIGFSIDWTKNPNEAELTVDSLVLTNQAKTIAQQHWDTLGAFEGLPYSAVIGGLSLDYFIDFRQSSEFSDSDITVKIRRRKALDKFMQDAHGLSFERLKKDFGITGIFNTPYVIVKDDQALNLILLGITSYNLTKAVIESVLETAKAIADVTAALPPVPGNIGAVAAAIIKAAARIIYTIALVVALIQLINQIIEILFPKIRYFKASFFRELLRQGCAALGYEFKSTLFDSLDKLTLLPVPLQVVNKSIFDNLLGLQSVSYTKGYPTANDTTKTLGLLIDEVLKWFNAKIRVEQNGAVVRIERRDYWQNQSGISVTNTLNVQDRRETAWTYNFDECWKRYTVSYQVDPSDLHTFDKLEGQSCEYSTEPVTVQNSDLVNISGYVDIDVAFSLGARKEKLNYVETVAYELAVFADSVVNTFGGNSDLASKVSGRIGVLQISQQYFRTSKVLWTVGGKQPANYLDRIGADPIYLNYHAINQVKENFKRIYQSPIPFNPQQFINLLGNNYVTDQSGAQLELLTFDWINEQRQANIKYAVPSDEASNVKTVKIA